MALYQKITITDAGAELISGIILNGGNPLTFEAVAVGSGELVEGATPAKFTGLVSEAKRLPIETVTQQGGIITVTARLATDTITADLYHREVGVYANGVLLAYGNTGDKYDYIPAAGNNAAVQKIIRVPLAIGTMQTSFAEMDTTDLVTHAALEARVASVVEPIVRGKVTAEMAEEALDEAVRVVAREVAEEVNADAYAAQVKAETAAGQALVAEANIDIAIDKALYEDGEYSTTTGTQDLTARCFEITEPVKGRVERIEIPCRSTTNAYDRMYKGTAVFLSIFEKDTSGEWVHIGISSNANVQTAGATAIYTFSDLKLSGRPLRFIVVTSQANTAFDTSLYMGARVTASTAGAAYEESSLATAQNYLIEVTFSGAYFEEKYVREMEESAATGWIWIRSHPGAGGTHLFTIGDKPILVPDTSSLTTNAEITAKYVQVINAAQPYVTAETAAVPAELGTGGYFFTFTANTPGAIGNGIRLALGSTPEGQAQLLSGDTLTGGRDSFANHMTSASCHVSEVDRARWDTPINARGLLSKATFEEIPTEYDLSNVIFAYAMCMNSSKLKNISGLYMPCAINTTGAFTNCPSLENVSGAVFEYAEITVSMFANDTALRDTGAMTFWHIRIAIDMFKGCNNLETFDIYLGRLQEADGMLSGCILNLASVQHIANSINTVTRGNITIGINAELQGNTELATALSTIRGKGWTVTEEYNVKTA